ncbi:hypothetical protein Pcinc_017000 [Petrolisthes cinctipes]|uniref:Uncharacterized protein n=1 Tax=Petrolisthes cinctipes TaxID=88211 RepID=A0AAE1FRQ4_PETCI|nr:hypothetical protein Pcinc_017000 [Petrolisthes cinctipes]
MRLPPHPSAATLYLGYCQATEKRAECRSLRVNIWLKLSFSFPEKSRTVRSWAPNSCLTARGQESRLETLAKASAMVKPSMILIPLTLRAGGELRENFPTILRTLLNI